MQLDNPYHEGERAVQERANAQLAAQRNGRAINDAIMPGALKFIGQQTMVVLGSVDVDGDLWASVLTGESGFVTAPDQTTILFDLVNAGSHPDDPIWGNIDNDPRVGMLLIELASRRRLRINGTITREADQRLRLDVAEAYPNCPQYIQRRHVRLTTSDDKDAATRADSGVSLTNAQRALMSAADTFFVASAHPQRGVDASHRGGERGFVRARDDRTIRVPDYPGNNMFNTLGNFEIYPRAGLAFIDFDTGAVLQLTGRPTVRWDLEDDAAQPTGGTRRYWDFTIERWQEASLAYRPRAELLDSWERNPARIAST